MSPRAQDFNGDGRPDLAVANFSSGDVTVFINDGNWDSYQYQGGLKSGVGFAAFPAAQSGGRYTAMVGGTAALVTVVTAVLALITSFTWTIPILAAIVTLIAYFVFKSATGKR